MKNPVVIIKTFQQSAREIFIRQISAQVQFSAELKFENFDETGNINSYYPCYFFTFLNFDQQIRELCRILHSWGKISKRKNESFAHG